MIQSISHLRAFLVLLALMAVVLLFDSSVGLAADKPAAKADDFVVVEAEGEGIDKDSEELNEKG